ncbi:carboxylesterase/lipase family protein [Terriglobus sp.]|uniref:carboxylesterase/lipase family protein n=1 Tax=Terriglobus sp. TaxID=1889013 RepID=UPI003AFF90D1
MSLPALSLTRRSFLRNTALTAAALQLPRPLFAAAPETMVHTPLGNLRGTVENNIRVFRGVPFAEPPVGERRFRAPVPKQGWTGVHDATQFAAEAWQTMTPAINKSEDCLYLNVWTPQRVDKPLPVFVYIHGGGFTGGRSFDPLTNGEVFARDGIVLVTVAYRLGVFGFLDVSPLLGPTYASSANNGVRDLIAALKWVQRNISAFGGDAAQVTIGGQSAGAKLSDILLGVPAARPLFHQVISESGGAERVQTSANAELVAQGFAKTWQEAGGGSNPASVKTANPAKLIAAQQQFIDDWPQHFPLRCEIDGTLMPTKPIEEIRNGSSKGKRLLLGTNRDESASFVGPHPSKDAIAADLGNVPVDTFAAIYAKYEKLYPDWTKEQRRIRSLTAEEYWVPSMRVAEAHALNGGETYVYRTDFTETSGRLKGDAYHGIEMPAVWGTWRKDVDNASAEQVLAKELHTAWVHFIRGDAPFAEGLPNWPMWTAANRETMLLSDNSKVEIKPQEAELQLWSGVL